MNSRQFKRSTNPQKPVVIMGAVWDRVCDVLEWVSKLTVGGGLSMDDGPSGPVIMGGVQPDQLRRVVCSMDGGDPGDAETLTRTSYTYTLYENDEVTVIAENVELDGLGNRILYAEMSAATRGIAYQDDDGEWKLIWCDEAFTQYNCLLGSGGSGS